MILEEEEGRALRGEETSGGRRRRVGRGGGGEEGKMKSRVKFDEMCSDSNEEEETRG